MIFSKSSIMMADSPSLSSFSSLTLQTFVRVIDARFTSPPTSSPGPVYVPIMGTLNNNISGGHGYQLSYGWSEGSGSRFFCLEAFLSSSKLERACLDVSRSPGDWWLLTGNIRSSSPVGLFLYARSSGAQQLGIETLSANTSFSGPLALDPSAPFQVGAGEADVSLHLDEIRIYRDVMLNTRDLYESSSNTRCRIASGGLLLNISDLASIPSPAPLHLTYSGVNIASADAVLKIISVDGPDRLTQTYLDRVPVAVARSSSGILSVDRVNYRTFTGTDLDAWRLRTYFISDSGAGMVFVDANAYDRVYKWQDLRLPNNLGNLPVSSASLRNYTNDPALGCFDTNCMEISWNFCPDVFFPFPLLNLCNISSSNFAYLSKTWTVPTGRGWKLSFGYNNFICYPPTNNSIKYPFMFVFEAPPEWACAGDLVPFSQGLTNCATPDRMFNITVGETVSLNFYAFDRNEDDEVDIVIADYSQKPASGQLLYSKAVSFSEPTGHKLWNQTYSFKAHEVDRGLTYRVCLRATSYSKSGDSTAYDAYVGDAKATRPAGTMVERGNGAPPMALPSSLVDRCLTISIASNMVLFGCDASSSDCIPQDYEAGGRFAEGADIYFRATGSSCASPVYLHAHYLIQCAECSLSLINIAVDPYTTSPGNFYVSRVPNMNKFQIEWRPTLQDSAASLCLVAQANFAISATRRCFHLRVLKCRHCLRAGETLQDVGRLYGTDWLQLYMSNPHLTNPDDIPSAFADLSIGVSYRVRPGDYIDRLAEKFLITRSRLEALNPELKVNEVLQPEQELCILPPVCDIECMFGSQCKII